MRYKKGKKEKGKEFGKEYLIPNRRNIDSSEYEEMDDDFRMPETDDVEAFQSEADNQNAENSSNNLDNTLVFDGPIINDDTDVGLDEEGVKINYRENGHAAAMHFVDDPLFDGDVNYQDEMHFIEDPLSDGEEQYQSDLHYEEDRGYDEPDANRTAQYYNQSMPHDRERQHDNEEERRNRAHSNEEQVREDYTENDIAQKALENRRQRKVRKRKNYSLRILCGMLCIGAVYLILTSSLFDINEIDVKNNIHYSTEEIVEMSGLQADANMFKTKMGPIEKTLKEDSYIKDVQIKRKPFHKVEIILEEREEKYCILSEDKYIIADYEGIVLSIVDEVPPLTVINNLKVRDPELGQKLVADSNLIYSEIISFLQTVEKNDLYFKQIEASDVAVKAYLTDIFLCKGGIKNMEKEIAQIKKVIHDLGGRQIGRGTIIVNGNGTCTFNPEI